MEQCYTCSRKLATSQSVIELEGVRYCSEVCRQKHRGKTLEEVKLEDRQDRRRALWKGLPLILVGSLLLLIPTVLVLVLLFAGYFRFIDIFGVIYFIPGGAILSVGIYNYKENAPSASRH